MGTEVLRPQDALLSDRFRLSTASFNRREYLVANGSHKANSKRKVSPKKDKRRTSAVTEGNGNRKKINPRGKEETAASGVPVMGQVTLLRRGESLDSMTSKIKGGVSVGIDSPVEDLAFRGTDLIDLASSEMVLKQIRLDGYAGSAFSLSPSPRSLPIPSFYKKLEVGDKSKKSLDDSATRDLRRLLRLD